MLLSYFANIRTTQFDHSSPVHPVSESNGVSLSVTDGQMKKDEQAEILVSYIGFLVRMTINVYSAPWAKTMMLVCNDKHHFWGYWGAGSTS